MDVYEALKDEERQAMKDAALKTAFEQAKMNAYSLECLLESAFDKIKYNQIWAALVAHEVNKETLLMAQQDQKKKNFYLPKFRDQYDSRTKPNYYQKQKIFSPPPQNKNKNETNQNMNAYRPVYPNVTKTAGFFPGSSNERRNPQNIQYDAYDYHLENNSRSNMKRYPLRPIASSGGRNPMYR